MSFKRVLSAAAGFVLATFPMSVSAQEQCQDFNVAIGDWEICQDYGADPSFGKIEHRFKGTDASDGFLYGFSGKYGQRLCSTSANALLDNWFSAGDCTEFCVDINVFKDGDGNPNQSSPFKPHFIVKGAGKVAKFSWSSTISDNIEQGSGWQTLCAPVSKRAPGDPLPVSNDGSWVFSGTDAEWNALFQNVDQVILPVDSVLPIHEEIGYDNMCVRGVTCPGDPDTTLKIEKNCAPVPANAPYPISAQCTIDITVPAKEQPSGQRIIFLEDILKDAGGTIAAKHIDGLTAAGWICSANPPIGPLDIPTCFIAYDNLTANSTVSIPVDMTFEADVSGQVYENCAKLSFMDFSAAAQLDEPTTFAPFRSNDLGPFETDIDKSCATISLPEYTPPKPMQCEAFMPTVACGANGGYQVSLSNSLAGTFDPTSIDVTVLTNGVTAQSHSSNPLTLFLDGAQPGQTVMMSLASTEHGAGSEPGLDLCCMGELEVTIPEGLVCEQPEEFLDISKTCEPTDDSASAALGDTMCFIDVTYSGPPPVAGVNDIIVTDVADPSQGVISFTGSHDPTGVGNLGQISSHTGKGVDVWDCGSFANSTTATCKMNTTVDDTETPGYWDGYTSSLVLYLNTDDSYKNCASASTSLADGSTLQAQDCHSEGDAELTIAKSAKFEVCYPGQACEFEYTVTNTGTGDYSDSITLLETALSPPGGTISDINPPLCANFTDLLAGGCTGQANIPAGSSIAYTVTYLPPGNLPLLDNGLTHAGHNCVSLDDTTLGEFDTPSEENGHIACTEFEIGSPLVEVEKTARGACEPNQDCVFDITISTKGQPFSGKVALYEQMGGLNPSIVSVTPPLPPACTVSNPLQCVLDVNLAANDTYVMTVTARYASPDDDPKHDRNCAWVAIVPDSTPTGGFDANAQTPPAWADKILYGMPEPSCVSLDPPVDTPEVTVSKTCDPVQAITDAAVPGYGATCQITITSTGPLGSPYTVEDVLLGPNGYAPQQVTGLSSSDAWVCPAVPVANASDSLACTIQPQDFPSSLSSTIDVMMEFGPDAADGEWRNCLADPVAGAETACVPLQFSNLQVEKSCDKSEVIARSDSDRYELSCDITVRGSHLPMGSPILISDQFTTQSTPTLGINNSNPQFANCNASTPTATQQAFTCAVDPAAINAAGPTGITTTISMIVAAPMADATNCAFGTVQGLSQTEQSCHDISVVVEDTGTPEPPIALSKTCTALPRLGAVQQYLCVIDVTSDGTPFSGDLVIDDVMTLPGHQNSASTIASITAPAPWSCSVLPAQCAISASDLAAEGNAGQITVVVSSLPADFAQPGAQNCAIADIPGNGTVQGCHVFTPVAAPSVSRSSFNVVKGGPPSCFVGEDCAFSMTVIGGSAGLNAPVIFADNLDQAGEFTTISGFPSACNPAAPGASGFACAEQLVMAPGDTRQLTAVARLTGDPSLTYPQTVENCFGVLVGDGSMPLPTGSVRVTGGASMVDFAGNQPFDSFGENAAEHISCASVIVRERPTVDVTKVCEMNAPGVIDCEITVTGTGWQTGDHFFFDDSMLSANPQSLSHGTTPWLLGNIPVPCTHDISLITSAEVYCSGVAPYQLTAGVPLVVNTQAILTNWQDLESVTNCVEVGNAEHSDVIKAESCDTIDMPVLPDATLTKTCQITRISNGVLPHEVTCDIQVDVTGPFTTVLEVEDNLTQQGAKNSRIVSLSMPGATRCDDPPFTDTSQLDCEIEGVNFPSSLTNTMTVVMEFDPVADSGSGPAQTWENCAFGTQTNQSCARFNLPIVPPPAPPASHVVTKTCSAPVQGYFAATDGWKSTCELVFTQTGGPGTTTVHIQDTFGSAVTQGSGIITDVRAPANGVQCPPITNLHSLDCFIDTSAMVANSQIVIEADVFIPDQVLEGGKSEENCVAIQAPGESKICVDITVPQTGRSAPELEPFKEARGECTVSKATQTYTCGFELGVRNVGAAAYVGPLVLDDTFGTPKPKSVKTLEGDGWECLRTDGLGTSCLNGSLKLDPGASTRVVMEVVIPGLPSGGKFENCIGIGIGDSKFLRASVMQSIMLKLGIDGGPVDGAPGRKTRSGVRELQERFGLEPTGEIDNEIFAVLGVPSTEGVKPSCITVDLPPMPVPEITCEPGQKKNSSGVCYWPETDCPSGQVKNSKGKCYTPEKTCPSGQKLNSKGQCYTPRKTGPKCDARSTVQQGDACACRYNRMRKVNSTRCVCRNTGLPPVRGVGCPKVKIERGEGDGAVPGRKKCIVVNGIRLCS